MRSGREIPTKDLVAHGRSHGFFVGYLDSLTVKLAQPGYPLWGEDGEWIWYVFWDIKFDFVIGLH
jgi:hypothetical protein